ncbi:M10 family metallopeptidase C-terminal domain-containing protein, partial [Azospirillum sp. TSO22-1]|uniref:M10 family metallopeptidase C-terminal domain-containing protein n=1 Tax=Azospirillum sp. TSO22-1 TaxID=716789 RepID=UPI0018EE9D92
YGGAGADTVYGGLGNDLIDGSADGDNGAGDLAYGDSGNDVLLGGTGADTLYGGTQNDTLRGGLGADSLYGGTGADVFVYASLQDSGTDADAIRDFSLTELDRIDLSAIDANALTADNDAFSYIGTAAFTGVAGQLRCEVGTNTWIRADVNGDGVSDLNIMLAGAYTLSASTFTL